MYPALSSWSGLRRGFLLSFAVFVILTVSILVLHNPQPQISATASVLDSSGSSEQTSKESSNIASQQQQLFPQRRVVHLDLKGAPPKLSYLSSLFPLIRDAGGTSLLIEYEDMFPYESPIAEASSTASYTRAEITALLDLADSTGLEVIPLVQTFGHMEHVLKSERFSGLREVPRFPESLCPSRNESMGLVRTMLDQVMSVHAGRISFFHIGCDEVFHLASCSACAARAASTGGGGGGRGGVFLQHVSAVAQYLQDTYSVQPLMWDDMLRSISVESLRDSGLSGGRVEPVVWAYGEDVDAFVEARVWQKYSAVFAHVWAASAFKGAFGERLLLPDVNRHLRNNLEWVKVIQRESHSSGRGRRRPLTFRGIILTGWSRYDHFAVLCELLPASVPSLVANLLAVSGGGERIFPDPLSRLLGCSNGAASSSSAASARPARAVVLSNSAAASSTSAATANGGEAFRRCRFPGVEVLETVVSLQRLRQELDSLESRLRQREGWMTEYNVRHNFTSTWRLADPVTRMERMGRALEELREKAEQRLREVFDEWTVSEWIEQNVQSLIERTNSSISQINSMMVSRTWPRRPLMP